MASVLLYMPANRYRIRWANYIAPSTLWALYKQTYSLYGRFALRLAKGYGGSTQKKVRSKRQNTE